MTNKEHRHLLFKDEQLTQQYRRQIRISDEVRNMMEGGRDFEIHNTAYARLFEQINETVRQMTAGLVGQPRGRQQGPQMRETLAAIERASYMPYRSQEQTEYVLNVQPQEPLEYINVSVRLNE